MMALIKSTMVVAMSCIQAGKGLLINNCLIIIISYGLMLTLFTARQFLFSAISFAMQLASQHKRCINDYLTISAA